MLVRAKRLGFYDNKRRKPGQEFHIENEKSFSKVWMERVGGDAVVEAQTQRSAKVQEKPAPKELI